MLEYAQMGFFEIWYSRIEVDELMRAARISMNKHRLKKVERKGLRKAEKAIEKARAHTNRGALSRLAERVDGRWRIKLEPPLIVRGPETEQLADHLAESFAEYSASLRVDKRALLSRYRLVDFARKVVGVGSVGTETFMLLLMGDRNATRCSSSSRKRIDRCSSRSRRRAASATRASGSSPGSA